MMFVVVIIVIIYSHKNLKKTCMSAVIRATDSSFYRQTHGMLNAAYYYLGLLPSRIACTQCRDAACCYRCSVVCLCVCLSLCWTQREPYRNG